MKTHVIFFLEEQRKKAHNEIVYLEKAKALLNTYI